MYYVSDNCVHFIQSFKRQYVMHHLLYIICITYNEANVMHVAFKHVESYKHEPELKTPVCLLKKILNFEPEPLLGNAEAL